MNDEPIQGDVSTLSLVKEVDKLVDEKKVNELLKSRNWILINVGNMIQARRMKEGMETKVAIGQAPYYILGRVR